MPTILFSQGIIKERRMPSIKVFGWAVLLFIFFSGNPNEEVVQIPVTEVHKSELRLYPNTGQWLYQGHPFNGFALTCHPNGALAEKIGFHNGKKQGIALKWYANGILACKRNYVENRLEGLAHTWWPNGVLSSESRYVHRQRHGEQKKWYPNGQIARLMQYYRGQEKGLQQAWLRTGKLYANYEAKNGRVFGLRRSNLCYQLKDETIQR